VRLLIAFPPAHALADFSDIVVALSRNRLAKAMDFLK
jgi:hypothetical protein